MTVQTDDPTFGADTVTARSSARAAGGVLSKPGLLCAANQSLIRFQAEWPLPGRRILTRDPEQPITVYFSPSEIQRLGDHSILVRRLPNTLSQNGREDASALSILLRVVIETQENESDCESVNYMSIMGALNNNCYTDTSVRILTVGPQSHARIGSFRDE